MITIENAKVLPIKVNGLLLTWSYSKSIDSREDYAFTLFRGYSPDGEYLPIYDIDGYETTYIDNVTNKRLWQKIYYKFKVVAKKIDDSWISDPICVSAKPDLIALEIVRRNDFMLQNKEHGIGLPMLCLVSKHAGPRCDCYDENKQRLVRSNCTRCYGTQVVGGFGKAILMWVNLSPDVKTSQVSEIGERDSLQLRAFTSNYPILSPKDILINPIDGRAYLVEDVNPTQKRGFLIHQAPTLSYIRKPHPIYTYMQKNEESLQEVLTAGDALSK